jgi:hypothetical protein
MQQGWDYLWVALLGGLVGTGELISRYRDEPGRVFRAPPAYLYIALNVVAAMAGLALVHLFGWQLGFGEGDSTKVRFAQVIVAGTAAMTLLRSSLFTARVGNQDVGVGPSIFMNAFLLATDRGVDRARALARELILNELTQGVSFQRAYKILPAHCLGLMQNLSPEEQAALGREVAAIESSDLEDHQKARLLMLALLNLVGERVLKQVVASLAPELRDPPTDGH